MKKVNFNFDLKDLNGKVLSTASKTIAMLLMSEIKGNVEKLFDLATRFNNGEVVELDTADFKMLEDLIFKTERLTVLVKVPIIRYLETIK